MKSKKYLNNFFCNDHPDERLNLVCISSTCPSKGLVCSLCKNDPDSLTNPHKNHQSKIVPFKHLIQSLEFSLDNHPFFDMPNQQNGYLRKLQVYKDQALSTLQKTVVKLSQLIQTIQQKIIDNFETSRSAILYKGEILRKLKSIIQTATVHDVRKEEKFQLINKMKTIVCFIKQTEGNRNHYQLNLSANLILAKFTQQKDLLRIKCQLFQKEFIKLSPSHPQDPLLVLNESRHSKKDKKSRRRQPFSQDFPESIQPFQTQMLHISAIQPEKKEKVSNKLMQKGMKKPKEQKSSKNMCALINEEIMKTIPNPIKQGIFKFLPECESQSQKMSLQSFEKEQQNQKCIKSSKMYELMSSYSQKKQECQHPMFSSLFKNLSIKINRNGKGAKQTSSGGLVLLAECLQIRKKLSFKIGKVKESIVIGVAKADVVAANKYAAINFKSLNHGVFGIDQKGLCLHHENAQNNYKQKQFSFDEHDIINMRYDQGVLWLQKCASKKGHKNALSLPIALNFSNAEQKITHICAYLGGKDDSIQII